MYERFNFLLILYLVVLLYFYVMLVFPLEVPLLVQFHLQYCLLLFVANLFFKLLTSKFKFPIFKFTIAMVWNNSTTSSICITSVATSSIDFGVLIYVVRFLDLSTKDPNSYTNIFPNPNSNDFPSTNPGLLTSTYSFGGLNIATWVCVPILSVYSQVVFRPPCVYCCCCCYSCSYCCKCSCKCSKCCGLSWLSIQSS